MDLQSDGDMELNESDGDELEEKYSPQDSLMESPLGEVQPLREVSISLLTISYECHVSSCPIIVSREYECWRR